MKKNKNSVNIMHEWFKHLWEIRSNKVIDEYTNIESSYIRCFECNKLLREESYKNLSSCYSHLLSKKKYPKLAGNEENVQICCPDCHNLYEMNPKKAIKQYEAAQELKKKYEIW